MKKLMNSKWLPALCGGLFSCAVAHAGDMGTKPVHTLMPYFGGEVSYNWIDLGSLRFNNLSNNPKYQPWGGRFSAGVLRFSTDALGFTGEIGGGYYGAASMHIVRLAANTSLSIDGYDALVGALYRAQYLDLFVKVGFMIQNLRQTINEDDLSRRYAGGLVTGQSHARESRTQVLPEIRVGGIYNIRNDLGVTLTYLHAFGSSPNKNENITASFNNGINISSVTRTQNPSLDAILLGLRYYVP